eukprot:NODE_681_length_674_cov_263.992687_g672_i0.p1 GENE.NODE_681_length_674_cov_263.992687_g672_i0~~NODE_681_length_674_cov_263.992687_g672_i0.p1  ORF type:complete len:150 (+),score=44.75 NODE_681_length_674_cov_263.992687_g672_i0:68-451(+)
MATMFNQFAGTNAATITDQPGVYSGRNTYRAGQRSLPPSSGWVNNPVYHSGTVLLDPGQQSDPSALNKAVRKHSLQSPQLYRGMYMPWEEPSSPLPVSWKRSSPFYNWDRKYGPGATVTMAQSFPQT